MPRQAVSTGALVQATPPEVAFLAREVVRRARQMIRPTSVPRWPVFTLDSTPESELALEETLEENPLLHENELYFENWQKKRITCCLMLDQSASLAGDRHFLSAVAVAVLMQVIPLSGIGLVCFNSVAQVAREMGSTERVESTLYRILATPPQGLTNLESALALGLRVSSHFPTRSRVGLLVTDGRSTAGSHPGESARQFDYLAVLFLDGPGSDAQSARDLAAAGHGQFFHVPSFSDLPRRLYDAVRLLARR